MNIFEHAHVNAHGYGRARIDDYVSESKCTYMRISVRMDAHLYTACLCMHVYICVRACILLSLYLELYKYTRLDIHVRAHVKICKYIYARALTRI